MMRTDRQLPEPQPDKKKEQICLKVCGPQGYDRKNGTE